VKIVKLVVIVVIEKRVNFTPSPHVQGDVIDGCAVTFEFHDQSPSDTSAELL